MNWFSIYLDYCRKSDLPASELQTYLLIWNDKYSPMIRRNVSMKLKEQLEQLPEKNQPDLASMLLELKNDLQPVIKFHSSTKEPEKVNKRISKKKKEQLDINEHLTKLDKALYKKWVEGV